MFNIVERMVKVNELIPIIYCQTKEESVDICRILHKLNYRLSDGRKYDEETVLKYWDKISRLDRKSMCFNYIQGKGNRFEYYDGSHGTYEIIKVSEYNYKKLIEKIKGGM